MQQKWVSNAVAPWEWWSSIFPAQNTTFRIQLLLAVVLLISQADIPAAGISRAGTRTLSGGNMPVPASGQCSDPNAVVVPHPCTSTALTEGHSLNKPPFSLVPAFKSESLDLYIQKIAMEKAANLLGGPQNHCHKEKTQGRHRLSPTPRFRLYLYLSHRMTCIPSGHLKPRRQSRAADPG